MSPYPSWPPPNQTPDPQAEHVVSGKTSEGGSLSFKSGFSTRSAIGSEISLWLLGRFTHGVKRERKLSFAAIVITKKFSINVIYTHTAGS